MIDGTIDSLRESNQGRGAGYNFERGVGKDGRVGEGWARRVVEDWQDVF